MRTHPAERAVQAISSACRQATTGSDLLESVSARLREVLAFDGAGYFAVDPATLLATHPVRVENIEPGHCTTYWDRECRIEDVLLYRDLARSAVPAGTLFRSTADRPERSPRYREYLAPQNYGDELRAALRVKGRTWAVVALYRDKGRRPFTNEDVQLMTLVGPVVATSLRSMAVFGSPRSAAGSPGGVALFDLAGGLLSLDDSAEKWFAEIGGPDWRDRRGPSMSSIKAVVAQAASVRDGRGWGTPAVRLSSPAGWLTLSASVLKAGIGRAEAIALTVAPARGPDITPLLAEAFNLTAREQECAEAVARGLSNQEIAAGLHVSPYTVRDHLKAAFTKMSVSSRSELVAKLFSDYYGPALHDSAVPVVRSQF